MSCSLKNDVNIPSKSTILRKKLRKKIIFCWRKEQDPAPDLDPLVRCADLDLYQNVTDLDHWEIAFGLVNFFVLRSFSIA
jgi:hypothetical protein